MIRAAALGPMVAADSSSAPGPAPGLGQSPPVSTRDFVRISHAETSHESTQVAEEVPVAFVYSGRPHVVMMCTPADLEDLAIGFSLTEEIVGATKDIGTINVTRHSRGIELTIEIPPTAAAKLATRARALSGRTGCGLCGVEAIDDAVRTPHIVRSELVVTAGALWRAGTALAALQHYNNETHSVHAAAWATPDGELRVVREDVGRHNALDKVLGALARSGTDARDGFIVITSRASFELVQKVAIAGIPLLAAVSRPTGLAIRLAEDAGITLVGLLRGESANAYTHANRISLT